MRDVRIPSPTRPLPKWVRPFLSALATVIVVVVALTMGTGFSFDRLSGLAQVSNLHAPDLTPIVEATSAIQIHLTAAVLAFGLGLVQIFAPKGSVPHRTLGWIWVGLMLVTAVSSFFIRTINPGNLSFIHALSGWTIIISPMIIYWARRHNIKAHKSAAIGLFIGGLVVAGALTFLPGRILWRVFFG